MSNSGEDIYLKDGCANVIDSVELGGGDWFAGENAYGSLPFATMERIHSNLPSAANNWKSNIGAIRNGVDVKGKAINGTPRKANSVSQLLPVGKTGVRINEVYPTSTGWRKYGLLDKDAYEFVELVNITDKPIDISFWWLMDESGRKITFSPGSVINPGEFWIQKVNKEFIYLNGSGECVQLYIPASHYSVDTLCYSQTGYATSISRIPDGTGEWQYGSVPTPGMGNRLLPPVQQNIPALESIASFRGASFGHWGQISGWITAPPGVFGANEFYIQDDSGRGILVFLSNGKLPDNLVIGTKVTVWGQLRRFSGDLEISVRSLSQMTFGAYEKTISPQRVATGSFSAEPATIEIPGAPLADAPVKAPGELVEGNLVQACGKVVDYSNFTVVIDDGSGRVRAFFTADTILSGKPYMRRGKIWCFVGIVRHVEATSTTQATPGYRLSVRYDADSLLITDPNFLLNPEAIAEEAVTEEQLENQLGEMGTGPIVNPGNVPQPSGNSSSLGTTTGLHTIPTSLPSLNDLLTSALVARAQMR